MPLTTIPLFLLALPILEIAVFIIVGSYIGVLATVMLVVATTIVGSILMRMQGFGVLRQIQLAGDQGRLPGREVVHGVMILLAGFLLFVPGFITDTLGLLLFIPPLREVAWRYLRERIVVVAGRRAGGFRNARPDAPAGRVIDLDQVDYKAAPDESSPWRNRGGKGE